MAESILIRKNGEIDWGNEVVKFYSPITPCKPVELVKKLLGGGMHIANIDWVDEGMLRSKKAGNYDNVGEFIDFPPESCFCITYTLYGRWRNHPIEVVMMEGGEISINVQKDENGNSPDLIDIMEGSSGKRELHMQAVMDQKQGRWRGRPGVLGRFLRSARKRIFFRGHRKE